MNEQELSFQMDLPRMLTRCSFQPYICAANYTACQQLYMHAQSAHAELACSNQGPLSYRIIGTELRESEV
jgi:hypothetical protein